MDKYGTDSFRFTLSIFAAQGRDVIMSEKRVEGYRAFTNKIWNATRYILMNLGTDFKQRELSSQELERFDKWILHSLNKTTANVSTALEEYRFNEAAQHLYDFFWHEFCDWYLELTKPRLYGKETPESAETAKQVLYYILHNSIKLMHPFMPFLTEEIWDSIKAKNEGRLIISSWPEVNTAFAFEKESTEVELFKEIVYKIRNLRGEMNVAPDKKMNLVFKTDNKLATAIVERESIHIRSLARVEQIDINPAYSPDKTDASAVIPDCVIYAPLKGLIDFEAEKARLSKELAKVEAELAKVEGKLSNESFVSKAPAEILDKEKGKKNELSSVRNNLIESISKLG
jgi:valyl-tRNA synthetase